MAVGLVACASAPKKSVSQPVGIPDKGGVQHSQLPGGKKKSPYAAAQEDPRTRGNYTAGGLYKPGVSDSTPDHVPDVDAIPEPEVTREPRSAVGNRETYSVLGKKYRVLDSTKGYVEKGTASYYGQKFHGRRTSNLEVYDMYAFTAAHKTLPLPSFARVTNLDNGKSVVVRVNDRGPFHDGRVIDLSYAAAVKLGITARGTGRVEVRALQPGDDDRPVLASAPEPAPARPTNAAPTPIDRLIAAMPVASARAGELPPGVRIATGKPTTLTNASANVVATATAAPTVLATPLPAAPAPTRANNPADGVVLQVASFTARANADRALTTLRQAGIDTAQISDASANGQTIWRLRVGPLQAAQAPELAARIAGLGFGQPQRVRD
ncbi:MAG TPA: septal ring lytic transglycosylase RlpA family protein [Lysobacter sp.]